MVSDSTIPFNCNYVAAFQSRAVSKIFTYFFCDTGQNVSNKSTFQRKINVRLLSSLKNLSQ